MPSCHVRNECIFEKTALSPMRQTDLLQVWGCSILQSFLVSAESSVDGKNLHCVTSASGICNCSARSQTATCRQQITDRHWYYANLSVQPSCPHNTHSTMSSKMASFCLTLALAGFQLRGTCWSQVYGAHFTLAISCKRRCSRDVDMVYNIDSAL